MKTKSNSGVTRQSDVNSRDRVARLFLWLDETLDHLEQRYLQNAKELTSAEREKDARTMISLIRVYEKLVEMKERLGEKERGAGPKRHAKNQAEQKRREIAQRIERLQRQQEDRARDTGRL